MCANHSRTTEAERYCTWRRWRNFWCKNCIRQPGRRSENGFNSGEGWPKPVLGLQDNHRYYDWRNRLVLKYCSPLVLQQATWCTTTIERTAKEPSSWDLSYKWISKASQGNVRSDFLRRDVCSASRFISISISQGLDGTIVLFTPESYVVVPVAGLRVSQESSTQVR